MFKMKGKHAPCLKVSTGIGRGHQLFKGTWCSCSLLHEILDS